MEQDKANLELSHLGRAFDACASNESDEVKPEPQEWDGDGEGLPPVGVMVEYCGHAEDDDYPLVEWKNGDTLKCLSIEVGENNKTSAVFWNENHKTASALVHIFEGNTQYHPIKSEADIQAEEREQVINEALAVDWDINVWDLRGFCECLYDVGMLKGKE